MPSTCDGIYRWHALETLGYVLSPELKEGAIINRVQDLEPCRSGTSKGYDHCSQGGRSHQVTTHEHRSPAGQLYQYTTSNWIKDKAHVSKLLATKSRRRVMTVEWEHQHQGRRSCLYHEHNGVKQGCCLCKKHCNPAKVSKGQDERWSTVIVPAL